MKIVHLCLSSFFVDNYLYQENELVHQHIVAGHDVFVIASTESYDKLGNLTYLEPNSYIDLEGARIIRLPYRRFLPKILMKKIRMHPGVFGLLCDFEPDIIIFHGSGGWELLTVARYIKKNTNCLFHIDSHADYQNSGKNWFSLHILHGFFYRTILRYSMKFSQPLLCISTDVSKFAHQIYGIPLSKLSYFPLGGRPLIDLDYLNLRESGRKMLNITSKEILLIQTGKLSKSKLLLESLLSFIEIKNPRLRFLIVGVLMDDIKTEALRIINGDPRIIFAGWKNPDQLTELLCASDVYIQPGSQSATMQQSLCCRCAIVVADIEAHNFYNVNNGWFIDPKELKKVFSNIDEANLNLMSSRSYEFAKKYLDYKVLANKLLTSVV
jgi:hypothetical protein